MADMVMMGDRVYVGTDENNADWHPLCVVIQFETEEELRAAVLSGRIECTVFGGEASQ